MMVTPTSLSVVSCSPPSSTLRAGYAGGLRPCLTAAARATSAEPGRDGETVRISRTEKLQRGQFLVSSKGQLLVSLDKIVRDRPLLTPRQHLIEIVCRR